MLKRPRFWLGLLLGSLISFRSFHKPRNQPPDLPEMLYDFIDDALIAGDAEGKITSLNAAGKELFGPQGDGYFRLGYPSGQAVPPGQLPLSRALRSGNRMKNSEYLYRDSSRATRTYDVSVRPLPGGGAVAVFRDLSEISAMQTLQYEARTRNRIVQRLGSRLNKVATLEEIAVTVVDHIKELFLYPVEAQIRLYFYSPEAKTLTRLAAYPENRPKRPKTAAQTQPCVFPFDAQNEALWQLYLLRKPSERSLMVLDEPEAASAYALPLVVKGVAIGHLGLSSGSDGAFSDPALQETLSVIASLIAFALAAPQSAGRAAAFQAQADALREIVQAVAAGTEPSRLADLITGHVRRQIVCEVCTLSVPMDGKLAVIGEAFQDDLLFPERITRAAPALHGKAVQKAWRTQKNMTQSGIANPSFETGPWRAFAGKSGRHSVVAMPLASHQGVFAVYTNGDAPLPESQVKFLQTIASLCAMGLGLPSASASEARADC